ncbi:carbamoyl-phosphate synthase large subunit [Georgfuchsia toluolica]|uniref:Carbamoyl-phosphate synthase large subunit n=1 Tax=Georgfuchsia toluolica TaxID=424218 RepID=A0A916N8R7_9PROT|nr:carbamoyl-phosphate synthase (glutamine-hydrolyzing) large subunit [Georgfuchsia toluolica]CAG4882923.1 carbamoyl-phosphate synthase large subunit [Georgfuchsia toluolica]
MSAKPGKVLILGSGALKIGEAGEFDYSGSQAIKALKEEGVVTVLVNPNIATIQTSATLADQIYLLPVTPYFVEQVIARERPDAIALGFGGQTALNCGLELARGGVLERWQVAVFGTPIAAIEATEDRAIFAARLAEIGVAVPRSAAATSLEEAVLLAAGIGYPVMVRVAYALGGLGSGWCADERQLRQRVAKGLAHSPQVLVEEYLVGWKEFEYEVVRDRFDNCIVVCNMENLDPMGIHTGESIVVAPSQTLSNREYHRLRELAIRAVRHFGVVGECNIQFAVEPDSGDYRVIEINARLSRSSALASKATGYPLAFVAAKLGLGYSLTELPNAVTRVTMSCFEPALDYVVVKAPRWDLQKFRSTSQSLGSSMKSVGEVMAIGRSFEEALQKALRMLDAGGAPAHERTGRLCRAEIEGILREPTPDRIHVAAEALRRDWSVAKIHALSHIDCWFLQKIRRIVNIEKRLRRSATPALLAEAKRCGFSDARIAELGGTSADAVRARRQACGIVPYVKQIDTLAGEYPALTNYLYLTHHGSEDDVAAGDLDDAVLVLGSGAYRIGSSVEFDWCGVNTVQALRRMGYKTIMLNNNPETVSTDFNECDRLYFEEITLETVVDICQRERPLGVIVSVGGQVPNNLAMQLAENGIRLLGTQASGIDAAEDRHQFSRLLDRLGILQPAWRDLVSLEDAMAFAGSVGYPVLVRPSYVLSGAAMGVAANDAELERFLRGATTLSPLHPVVISKFLENARELEIDAVACNGQIVVAAVSEHVENAGVHSGDATLVLPPQRTYLETIRRIRAISARIAAALNIHGPFNMQFLAKANEVSVIECNLRASRSFPFVSKVTRINFIEIAAAVMMGRPVEVHNGSVIDLDYVGVKAPQFSFMRLEGADPVLGVEMASTGEVGCIGDDFEEAFLKALLAVGFRLPVKNALLSTGPIEDKAAFLESARTLRDLGINLFATAGTATFLNANGVGTTLLHWPSEGRSPNTLEYLSQGKLDLVINIPKSSAELELSNDYLIRRHSADFGIPLITNIQLAQRFVEAIAKKPLTELHIKSWKEYAPNLPPVKRVTVPDSQVSMRPAVLN